MGQMNTQSYKRNQSKKSQKKSKKKTEWKFVTTKDPEVRTRKERLI